jgi:hypothetical protein
MFWNITTQTFLCYVPINAYQQLSTIVAHIATLTIKSNRDTSEHRKQVSLSLILH